MIPSIQKTAVCSPGCIVKKKEKKNLRKKNIVTITLKTVTFCVKQLILINIQLIQEYRSTVNGLIKTILDKALYKLHLTKILKENHHPIKSK